MRCINCQLCILRLRKHRLSDESAQVVERVQKWVYPRDVTGDDYICHSCWELTNDNPNEDPECNNRQQLGHRKVCVSCGKSILRVRSRLVLKPEMSEKDIQIGDIVSEWIRPRQLTNSDEICVPCYLRAKRLLDRSLKSSASVASSTSSVGDRSGHSMNEPSSEEILPIKQAADTLEIEEVSPSINRPPPLQVALAAKIELPTLRRAADTSSHCLFLNCKNSEIRRVPDRLRKHVIKNFHFFIPRYARICNFHLGTNLLHELYASENAITTFSAVQIEEVIYLIADDSKLDFLNPENIDDRLFEYLFGRTKDEYKKILLEVPQLNHNKIKIGFSAFLCKMQTGDSDERISSLFRMPRRTLEVYMQRARVIFCPGSVPRHLGRIHKVRKEFVRKKISRNSLLVNSEEVPEGDVDTEQPASSENGSTSPPQFNAQVTHTAERIQEDQTKAFIAKVFHYLEHEFEVLKKMDAETILSNLSKVLYRTAMATGVSETTVLEILKEEARRNAATRESVPHNDGEPQASGEHSGQSRKPARKRRRVCKKQSLAESSSDASDGSIEEVVQSSIGQDTTIEPEGEMLVVKAEPFEYYNEEPAIKIEPVNPTAVNKDQAQTDPISLDVKKESSDDDEENDSNETLEVQPACSKRRRRRRISRKSDVTPTHAEAQLDAISSDVKLEPPEGENIERRTQDVYCTPGASSSHRRVIELDGRRTQDVYCTPGASSSHRRVIELDGRSLLRVSAVKVEMENDEEGFS